MAEHPYEKLPARAFWRRAVADRDLFSITDLWRPRFPITRDSRIATIGSCFAAHLSHALRSSGFAWVNEEQGPDFLSPAQREDFGYTQFSARVGNVYTCQQFAQWIDWALGGNAPDEEVWSRGDRVVDPFRPTIEPDGFSSREEMLRSRRSTLDAVARVVRNSDVLIFTLGLTEGWVNRHHGHAYAICPGTAGGTFDPTAHAFLNADFADSKRRLDAAISGMRQVNPDLKVVLTVSPVPLTATATSNHVLVATTYSKSVLRAVAGDVAASTEGVDYFPSYEIITAPAMMGVFFEPNRRQVTRAGIAHVMSTFFAALSNGGTAKGPPTAPAAPGNASAQTSAATAAGSSPFCDEELLDAFGER